MIVEMREYLLKPKFPVETYIDRYRREGMELQTRILGGLAGSYATEIGELNKLVTLWRYDGLGAREERRAQLAAEPAWRGFVASVTPMFVSMNSTILRPTRIHPE